MSSILKAILFMCACLLGVQTCQSTFTIKPEHLNKRLLNFTVLEKETPLHHDCVRECMLYPLCKSINYNPRTNVCEFNTKDSSLTVPEDFETVAGVIFSDITMWPQVMVGGCAKNSCSDKQRCLPTGNTYTCADIDCGPPPTVPYASWSSGETTVGTKRTLQCPPSQYATGNPAIECQFSGTWNSSDARCKVSSTTNYAYDNGANTDPAVLVKFAKIRLNPKNMTIDTLDLGFATSSTGSFLANYRYSLKLTSGVAASCNSGYGSFKIDTTGTGVIIDTSITWRVGGYDAGMSGFARSSGGAIITANSGGKCGWCSPESSTLSLQFNPDDVVSEDGVTTPKCV